MEKPKDVAMSYLPCWRPNHDGEVLNLICIEKTCPARGLLCSLCKEEHQNHRVKPLKVLLATLRSQMNERVEDEYCNKLQELQELKNSLLYGLKLSVDRIASAFQRLEQDILDEYQRCKMDIIEQIQLNMQLPDMVAAVVAGPATAEQYRQDFAKLAKWIHHKDKDIYISADFETSVQDFRGCCFYFNGKLSTIEREIETHLQKHVEVVPSPPPIVLKPSVSKTNYRFSEIYKGSSIEISGSKKVAKQTQSGNARFVIIEEGMGLKERKIVFRVASLKNWVGMGICLRDRIVAVNYAFKYESLGHGSYLLSNNGYSWSHSESEDNIHACQFLFKQGSIMEVVLTESSLEFKLRDNNTSHKLKIAFKEEEWPMVCFCANLCSQEDAIEILDQ